jgi:dTDP-4-dehydrorhamnose 3,5-epimerase-like enzyme
MKVLKTKKIKNKNGSITVFQKNREIKFKIERLFIVKANKNQVRGMHAHKKCIQLINCLSGSIQVNCEDLFGRKKKFILNNSDNYLVVPTFTWCTQKYLEKNTILISICNKKFEEKDYIRDYSKFKKLQKIN